MEQSIRPITLNDVISSLVKLTENLIAVDKKVNAIQYQLNTIQVSVNTIKNNINNTTVKDEFNILRSEILKINDKISDIKSNSLVNLDTNIDYKELTGKRIAQLKEIGMSWNVMTEKYNVPKSTLQYRYRQYKNSIGGANDDSN